jgi:hypothetical protein
MAVAYRVHVMCLMGRSFTLATSVGLLLVPIEAGGDEFPMNFVEE